MQIAVTHSFFPFLGLRSGAKFANGLEIEAAVNRTEEAVKANKIAMIESVFAVKRQALRAVSSIKQEFTAVMSSFLNASIDNLNTALTAAQNGMIGIKNNIFQNNLKLLPPFI